MLLEDIRNEEQAVEVAERINEKFQETFHIEDHHINTTTSMGLFIIEN
ncbi:MAG: hypothetical protein H0Z32_11965 [Bacillaceae bacterium]|nr:hypothetical protein [Bacillaceae bacterium]